MSLYNAVAEALQDSNLTNDVNEEIVSYLYDYKDKTYDESGNNSMAEYVGNWVIYIGRGDGYVYFEIYVQ